MNDFTLPRLTEINYLAGIDNAPEVRDITIATNTSLPSTQDGDMVTLYAKNLTIDAGATLTVANRCKGLRIVCFGDCTINGTISMTARGASAIGDDVSIDIATQSLFSVKFPAEMRAIDQYLKNFFNPDSSFDDMPESVRPVVSKTRMVGQTIGTVPAVGANGGAPVNGTNNGAAGIAGTGRKCGGGGSGAAYIYTGTYYSGAGGAGTSFSGGAGGGGSGYSNQTTTYIEAGSSTGGKGGAARWNGTTAGAAGGGAGNPGGAGAKYSTGVGNAGNDGTGGLLILIVVGNLTVNSGAVIESKGSAGGSTSGGTYRSGGGGSGGGSINIAYGGSYAGAGTVSAAGGAGGAGTRNGGAGGAGCVTVENIVFDS